MLREVWGDSGLEAYLGVLTLSVADFDARVIGKTEFRRHFFHWPVATKPGELLRHVECCGAGAAAIAFDFFWLPLVEAQMLSHGHGRFVEIVAVGSVGR